MTPGHYGETQIASDKLCSRPGDDYECDVTCRGIICSAGHFILSVCLCMCELLQIHVHSYIEGGHSQ